MKTRRTLFASFSILGLLCIAVDYQELFGEIGGLGIPSNLFIVGLSGFLWLFIALIILIVMLIKREQVMSKEVAIGVLILTLSIIAHMLKLL